MGVRSGLRILSCRSLVWNIGFKIKSPTLMTGDLHLGRGSGRFKMIKDGVLSAMIMWPNVLNNIYRLPDHFRFMQVFDLPCGEGGRLTLHLVRNKCIKGDLVGLLNINIKVDFVLRPTVRFDVFIFVRGLTVLLLYFYFLR